MNELSQEPAIQFKGDLSEPAYVLLNTLILDLYSTIKKSKDFL